MTTQVELNAFEADIPSELKEFPPRSTLATLDRNLDQLLTEVKLLNESRQKDFANTEGRRDRLGISPTAGNFEQFRQLRQERLDSIQKIEQPLRIKSSSRTISKELERYWKVEHELSPSKILDVLESFYKNKAAHVLEENSLLVSRWARFCRNAHDINKFHNIFSRYQAYLQNEYTDSLDRYDRISKLTDAKAKANSKDERPNNIEQMIADRKNKTQKESKAADDGNAKIPAESDTLPKRTRTDPYALSNDSGVEVSDLVVYLRWIITQWSGSKDLEKFVRRMKVAVHSERVPIFQFYQIILESEPGELLEDCPESLEGVNCYVQQLPLKNSKIEDFITEFDSHISHFKIETSISQEDGRPLYYEVESRFHARFQEQVHDMVLPPYDGDGVLLSEDGKVRRDSAKPIIDTSNHTRQSRPTSGATLPNATRLRQMDWSDYVTVHPKYDEWLEDQMSFLKTHKEIDYELRYTYELVASQDIDFAAPHLRDSAKKLFELAAAANPNAIHSRPNKGSSGGPMFMRQGQTHNAESDEPRLSKPFDLGILIPDARAEKTNDLWVLDEKKKQFGVLLARNDEIRQIEQEMSGLHGAKVTSRAIDPTIATIFAEHEIHAFVLLRYLKLREVRSTLLRQMNFFRSVEKRVSVDSFRTKHRNRFDPNEGSQAPLDATILMQAASTGRMWRQQELFDLPDQHHPHADTSNTYSHHTPSEDLRTFVNGRIHTRDYNGVPFIYDSAVADLEKLEHELIKIGTLCINGGVGGHEAVDSTYMDEMRSRASERRSDVNDETFLNPGCDRAQVLLELYEHEVKFQNAKIELTNCLLEAKYFSRDYSLHTKALDLQASLISQMVAHGIHSHRSWVIRHFTKIDKSFMTDDPDFNFVPNATSMNLNKYIDSPFSSGLPHKPAPERQRVTMHHGALSVYMTEVVPMLEKIVDVLDQAKLCSVETRRAIKSHAGEALVPVHVVDCANWAVFMALWEEQVEAEIPLPGKPGVGLDSEVWTENPLLGDIVITEMYNPYHYTSSDNARALGINLGPMSAFSDPAYQETARSYAHLLTRLLLIKNRLNLSWTETEYWRRALDLQYVQMGVNRRAYGARLAPLPLDGNPLPPDVISTEEDEIEDYQEESFYESYTDLVSASSDLQNFGLAMAEIDRLFDDFNFSTFEALQFNLRWQVVRAMTHSLRVQMLEKNYLMGAVELHSLLLAEIHKNALTSSFEPGLLDSSQRLDVEVDYRLLATSIVPKKRKLRRAMLLAYTERLELYGGDEKDEDAKKMFVDQMKDELIHWYCNNLAEVVVEWSERSEFAKLMLEVKRISVEKTYGKLLFRSSKILNHLDYFATLEKGTTEDNDNNLGVSIQDVVAENGTEKIAKLWYIPHITEIILGLVPTDKGGRAADVSRRAFRNSLLYRRSLIMYTLVLEILTMFSRVAVLLQENRKFVSSVKTIREADYVVQAMNSIKKDLSYQGQQADYERVERYLLLRWGLLRLRLKLSLTMSLYALKMNLMKPSYGIVESAWYQSGEKIAGKPRKDIYQRLSRFANSQCSVVSTPLAGKYWLSYLDDQAKRVCDAKIVEIEECLEEHTQSTTLTFGENADELIKVQGDYLVSTLKLYAFRNEYLRMILDGRELETEIQLQEFFRLYKIRILVDSVRLYHRQGSRGGGSTSSLLRTSIISSAQEGGYNRLVQSNFEKCQSVVLQAELLREYTVNLHKHGKSIHTLLSDERTGRLFRHYTVSDSIPDNNVPHMAMRFTEESYAAKQVMLTQLVADLYKASVEGAKDTKNDNSNFTCTKAALSHSILKFSTHLGRWQEKRRGEHENFLGTLYGRLLEMIRNAEKVIENQQQEKQEILDEFAKGVKLAAADLFAAHLATHSATTVELNDLRKARRLDERKLRNRIVDEYDDLMSELVMEINLLRQRFAEYRVGTVQEVMDIMSETKKEELGALVTSKTDLPMSMRKSADIAIQHEEALSELREDNHELKMTILKFRSMNTIKEQAIRSAYEKRIRKLTDENKKAEEKLWDSFREAEAREKSLRRQLAKTQRGLTDTETVVAELTVKLKEEKELRVAEKQRDRPGPESRAPKKTEHKEDVERLLKDLAEKSKLIEQLVSERQAHLQEPEDIDNSKVVSRPASTRYPSSQQPRSKSPRRSVYFQDRVGKLEEENADLRMQLFKLQDSLSPPADRPLQTAIIVSQEVDTAVAAEPTANRKVVFQEDPASPSDRELFSAGGVRYPYYEQQSNSTTSPPRRTAERESVSRPSRSRPSTTRASSSADALSITNSTKPTSAKPGTGGGIRSLVNTPLKSPKK
ncbi:hypothetical protein SmJEL517_g00863 [Synchytrium microbalum]|uniref:DUF4549 domain-containing protein n=1 Tax=Synchytrium microbalum TaxID=1806994 RepID=A0A507C7M9_9FUNG|nr:uncharacterized protein SmJEL517_g00863 [Synchytrium microbalum]TPX37057.1 hypothetical protein SmJEL517_g00863 [Synchytrium microbalum]